jgi:hypothetical protein
MSNPNNYGAFLPTTNVWDVNEIYSTDVSSQAFKELLVRLYQNINNIAVMVNIKESGFYNIPEFVTGSQFFPNPSLTSNTMQTPTLRPVLRTLVNFGALPNAASKSIAHNIPVSANYSFTRIYGTATQPNTAFIPLPYASVTPGSNIELSVSPTQVTVTTAIDYSAFTICYIILEYIRT